MRVGLVHKVEDLATWGSRVLIKDPPCRYLKYISYSRP